MGKKKNKLIIQKIEFDEITKEPVTIQLQDEPVSIKTELEEKESPNEEVIYHQGKQLMMKQVFGFENKKSAVEKRQRVFKNFFVTIFAIFLTAVILWTAYNDFFSSGEKLPSWNELSSIFSTTWKYLIYAVICLLLTFVFKAAKLSLLSKTTTGKFHWKICFETATIGLYYNNATPLAVGGQPFEFYHLSKNGINSGAASSLTIATYLFNQIGYVCLCLFALICFSTNAFNVPSDMVGIITKVVAVLAYLGISFCLILPVIVIIFSFNPKLGSKLVAVFLHIGNKLKIIKKPKETAIKTYKTVIQNSKCLKKIAKQPIVFISMFVLSLLEHLAGFSIAYFSIKFFGFDWSEFGSGGAREWIQFTHLCMILSAGISFIPTPGNAGAADLSFYLLFKNGLGLSFNGVKYGGFSFPAMITWRVLSYYSYLIIGLIFTTVKRNSNRKKQGLKNASLSEENSNPNGG